MNALFIVGGPGSGKDVYIKYITERYNIKEYTAEQLTKLLQRNTLDEMFVVKCNAYNSNILSIKEALESKYIKTTMIFVDVDNGISRQRLRFRNIPEEIRLEKYNTTKDNIKLFESSFDNFILCENNEELSEQSFVEINDFIFSIANPVESIIEKHLKKAKDYAYSNFMLDKEKIKDNKKSLKSFYSHSPIKPDGYNEYDIRTAGQANIVSYSESIDSPAPDSPLTGMSFQSKDDAPANTNYDIVPSKHKSKFNSPAKPANSAVWKRAKRILFKG